MEKKMRKILFFVLIALITIITGNYTFSQCTCASGCSSLTVITMPFTKDGAGEFCFQTSCIGAPINSWNLDKLGINGVDFTNKWADASGLPAPASDGKYYIYYKASYSWSHFEATGSCSGGTTPGPTEVPTSPPGDTSAPADTPAPTTAPADTTAPTVTPAPTETPGPTAGGTSVPTTPPVETPVPTAAPPDTPSPTGTGVQQQTVRLFWLKPSDFAYDQKIVDGIGNVMMEVQRFYFQELGKTFHLNNPIVEVVNGDHAYNWYQTNDAGWGDPDFNPVGNMANELMAKFGLKIPDTRWLVVGEIQVEPASNSGAGGCGGNGWVYLCRHDADGAAGYSSVSMNRWYGGMAHEFGHALGLPDSSYTDGTPMSASFYDYPNCHFNADQKNYFLNQSAYKNFLYTSY
jgi:hypothetical protein